MSLERNLFSLKRTKGKDLIRLKNILIRLKSNGMRYYGVMKLGHNLESTLVLGLLEELVRRYIISMAAVEDCFGRRIGRQLMRVLTKGLLSLSLTRFWV